VRERTGQTCAGPASTNSDAVERLKRDADLLRNNTTTTAASWWSATRTAITTTTAANKKSLQGQQLPGIRSATKRPLHGRYAGAA